MASPASPFDSSIVAQCGKSWIPPQSAVIAAFFVQRTVDVVDAARSGRSRNSRSTSQLYRARHVMLRNVRKLATLAMRSTSINIYALLVMLTLLDRLEFDPWPAKSLDWAYERVLLGTLIVAEKYANDYDDCFDSYHWSRITGVGMEDLNSCEKDVLRHFRYALEPSAEQIASAWPRLQAACFPRDRPNIR